MTTPVLSKKQQKKALSAKKTPAKGLRNVLAQPREFHWPILKDDPENILKILLEKVMSDTKRQPIHVPWSQLRKLSKEERQVVRNKAKNELDNDLSEQIILKSIVMGVNGVTRLLEKDDASCVLLEANVEPLFLIKHIISMAEMKSVPALVVPFLKSVMLDTIGFTCAAMALKKTVASSESDHFYPLYEKIAELATFHTNVPAKLDFNTSMENNELISDTKIQPGEKSSPQKSHSKGPYVLSTNVYKYRNSRSHRAFVPKNSGNSENLSANLGDDFITLAQDSSSESDENLTSSEKNKKKTRYIDLHEQGNVSNLAVDDESDAMDIDNRDSISSSDFVSIESSMDLTIQNSTSMKSKSPLNHKRDPLKDNVSNKKRGEKFQGNVKYESLKVKRLQGNANRVKKIKINKKK